jgi:hypothetical protein
MVATGGAHPGTPIGVPLWIDKTVAARPALKPIAAPAIACAAFRLRVPKPLTTARRRDRSRNWNCAAQVGAEDAVTFITAPAQEMSMASRLVFCLLLSLGAATAFAQQGERKRDSTGELALSNDTLELRYIGGGPSIGGDRSSQFNAAVFLSEGRDIVLSGGLAFPAGLELGRLTLMFGPQVYAALLQDENNDILSITAGLQARFLLDRRSGLAVVGRAFHGPDILTFGTADNLTDLSARLEIQVAERILAFGGMRWFEFDLIEGGGEQTLQEEAFVGIGYRF